MRFRTRSHDPAPAHPHPTIRVPEAVIQTRVRGGSNDADWVDSRRGRPPSHRAAKVDAPKVDAPKVDAEAAAAKVGAEAAADAGAVEAAAPGR